MGTYYSSDSRFFHLGDPRHWEPTLSNDVQSGGGGSISLFPLLRFRHFFGVTGFFLKKIRQRCLFANF